MRLSAVVLSSLSALFLLSACDATYDHPPIRSGAWFPTGYAKQHEGGYEEVYEYETVEISGQQVSDIPETDTTTVYSETTDTSTAVPPSSSYGTLANETYFVHGSSYLNASDKKAIRAVAKDISGTSAQVTVVGHASQRVDGAVDENRKDNINYDIAQKRAVAVSKELTKSGVDSSRVTAVSKGDDEPNSFPGDRTQEAADRRVEIFSNQ